MKDKAKWPLKGKNCTRRKKAYKGNESPGQRLKATKAIEKYNKYKKRIIPSLLLKKKKK
jgi:hypothetical protein